MLAPPELLAHCTTPWVRNEGWPESGPEDLAGFRRLSLALEAGLPETWQIMQRAHAPQFRTVLTQVGFFLFFWFFSFFLVFSALQKVVKWEKRGHVRLAGRLSANNSLQYLPPCVGIRTSSPKRVADLPQRLLTAQDQPSREHELDCPLLQLLHRKLCMFFSSLRMETCQARHCGRRDVMLPLSWGAFRVYF